jgi:hypothetical protein
MPAVKFLARLDLDQIPYLDGLAKLMILQTFGNTSGPNGPGTTPEAGQRSGLTRSYSKRPEHVISEKTQGGVDARTRKGRHRLPPSPSNTTHVRNDGTVSRRGCRLGAKQI